MEGSQYLGQTISSLYLFQLVEQAHQGGHDVRVGYSDTRLPLQDNGSILQE